jgi:hypothetical protein
MFVATGKSVSALHLAHSFHRLAGVPQRVSLKCDLSVAASVFG